MSTGNNIGLQARIVNTIPVVVTLVEMHSHAFQQPGPKALSASCIGCQTRRLNSIKQHVTTSVGKVKSMFQGLGFEPNVTTSLCTTRYHKPV